MTSSPERICCSAWLVEILRVRSTLAKEWAYESHNRHDGQNYQDRGRELETGREFSKIHNGKIKGYAYGKFEEEFVEEAQSKVCHHRFVPLVQSSFLERSSRGNEIFDLNDDPDESDQEHSSDD